MRPTFLKHIDTSRQVIVLAIFTLLATNALTPLMSPNGDNASYIILSESLASGKGYINTFYPGEPAETQYPPLLPVLLLPITILLGQNFFAMKIVALIFGILGLIAMFRLLKTMATPDTAWIVTLLTAVNAAYIFFGSSILTETIYVFLSACVLLTIRKIMQTKEDRIGLILAAAVLIALSFYARTIGATLALSMCGFLFFNKRYKASILLALFIGLLLLPWALRSIQVHNSYFDQLTEKSAGETETGSFIVLHRLAQNLPRYAGKSFVDLVGGPTIATLTPYNPIKITGSLLLSGLFLFGFLRNLKSSLTPENAYLIVYLGILSVWPYHDARFLLPILPLLFYYMIEGLEHLPIKTDALRQRTLTGVTVVLLLTGIGSSLHLVYFNRTDYYQPEIANFKDACTWIKSNAPKEALVISRKPRLSAIWSDRKSWWYTDPTRIPQKDQLGNPIIVTHVIVTEFPISGVNLGEGFEKMRAATPNRFELLYRTPSPTVSVYALSSP
ncbi:MAG: hypothetical protein ACI8V2_002890 [Candidatus Latescibacterota bacterium]|jgi:hypothetical protein